MENLNQKQQINCKRHNLEISYIKTSSYNDPDNFLKCGECIIKDKSLEDCLFIEALINSQDNYIFSYLPPLFDKKLNVEIEATLQNQIDPIQQIEESFKNFEDEIIQRIQETKKLAISYALSQKINEEDVLKTYRQISKIQELKQILTFKDSKEESIKKLIDFFQKQHEQKELNTLAILDIFDKFKKYQQIPKQQLDLSNIAKSYIKSLDNYDAQIKKYSNENEQNRIKKQEINNLIEKQEEKNYFQFYDEFVKLFKYFNSQYNQEDILFSKCLSSLYKQICLKNNQIQNLFGQYSFQNREQSNLIIVQEDCVQNKINIQKNKIVKVGCVYFKYELNQNKKYIVRFKFNDQGGNWITLGLINSQNVENTLSQTHQGKAFGQIWNTFGAQIVEGDYFYSIQKDMIVEMRININEKQIQYLNILSFPQYQSINQLNQEYLLNPNNKYYLAIDFGIPNNNGLFGMNVDLNNCLFDMNVDIIYFQEVDNF